MRVGYGLILAALLIGCSREYYRRDADRETYTAVAERMTDPRWPVPRADIDPPSQSRLHDPFDPDRPPLPPDDESAHRYMYCANGNRGYDRWHENGYADWIESPHWRAYLGLNERGVLVLDPNRAVELGILHSREYQAALEELYLSSLSLTLNRFEFEVQWFGRNDTTYEHFGNSSLPIESNTLTTDTAVGFNRALTTGGQLMVNFANSFVWEYTGPDSNTVSSNIMVNFIQPLLRGAGREVRMEKLTQGERDLLYAVRDFARFRKEFYVNVTTRGSGFLSLLLQVQNIRNLENNVKSLEQNLRIHEALNVNGQVSPIQVDQVFQSYQQGRLALLQSQTALETALDEYKNTLGLPPNLAIQLNDAQLAPFQLNDPAVTLLQEEVEKFLREILQPDDPPPLAHLLTGFKKLLGFQPNLDVLTQQIDGELVRWQKQLSPNGKDAADVQRERIAYESLVKQLAELREDIREQKAEIEMSAVVLNENNRRQGWDSLQERTRKTIDLIAQLFVIQTQIRVYLIQLKPIHYALEPAVEFARANRLDLMNRRAKVVDAWRKITVAADGLESDLNVIGGADIRIEADASNPFDFAASNSSYRVGVQFDSPLNRKAERNTYRASLINYQRARRGYMAQSDQIEQAIRRDLRQLETQRLNFEIARQSLVSAARQVEQTRDELRNAGPLSDSSSTQDILNALNSLLQAKNTLIGSWVNYETGRLQLLLDLEALTVDERGLYTDEPITLPVPPVGNR